jgi:DNA-directed RNA polymerase subunit F
MRGKKMDNDNAKKINDSLNNLNKIMSLILVLAFDGSTFKSKTNDEIKKVMPRINETLKSIHENIYD